MGGLITRHLYWGGDPEEINEVSGLNMRDTYHVQKSWAVLYKNAGQNGMIIFLGLFRQFPETKNFFKMIKDLSEEQIAASPQFKAHCHNLMSSINTAILNLNEPQVVIALMNKLGDSHRIRRIQKRHFYGFKEVVMDVLSNDLKLSENYIKSWAKFIDFIFMHIFDTLKAQE